MMNCLRFLMLTIIIMLILAPVGIVSTFDSSIKYFVVYSSPTTIKKPDYIYRNCLVYHIDYINETVGAEFVRFLERVAKENNIDEVSAFSNSLHRLPNELLNEFRSRLEKIFEEKGGNFTNKEQAIAITKIVVYEGGIRLYVYVDENIDDEKAEQLFKNMGKDMATAFLEVFKNRIHLVPSLGESKPVVITIIRDVHPRFYTIMNETLEKLVELKYSKGLKWLVGIGITFGYLTLDIDMEKLKQAGLSEKEAIDIVRNYIGEEYPMIVHFVEKPLILVPLDEQTDNENKYNDNLLDEIPLQIQAMIPIIIALITIFAALLYKHLKNH